MKENFEIIEWLLEGDPSIRYQTLRDLSIEDEGTVLKEQRRIEKEGWGAELLKLQDPEGTWAKSLYSRKWISTTYTMLLLRRLGLPPENIQVRKACKILLDEGFYEEDGGINYSRKSMNYSETCITGMILSILSYFKYDDERLKLIVEHLFRQQMKDGGWNCRSYKGDTHSSFHTTISVLEGLREYEKNYNTYSSEIQTRRNKTVEFLLQHKLYRSHRTGEIFDERMTRFSFPPRWHYDVMRILDHFQELDIDTDERMKDAIELLQSKRKSDGFWRLQNKHPGKSYFEMEETGQPSRWNTLRALRILDWWYDK